MATATKQRDTFAANVKQGAARKLPVEVAAADGAISIVEGSVIITKGTAAALTMDDPHTSTNGCVLHIVSTTAAAHTVTLNASTNGVNGAGASGNLMTFGAAIGNNISLIAYNGTWYTLGTDLGVTIS